jgi:hypothetical protein
LEALRIQAAGGNASRYEAVAAEVCHQRRFFMTRKTFYGIGPGITELYDTVCVILGADVPFVLRKKGNYYQLIGECYVHGLMLGQAVHAWRAGMLEAKDIELH